MANFFKSLFKAKDENNENGQERNNKKNFEILKYDGLRAQRMGRSDYAIKCFTGALEIEEDFETMGYLTQAYIATNNLQAAHNLLNRMVELEPEYLNSYMILANICYMQEAYADMKKAAQKAVELEKENATAHYLLAKAHQGLKEDVMTIAQLTQAIALKSDYMEALLMRTEVLMQMQQYKEAQKDIETVLELNAEEETALLLRGKLKEVDSDETGAESDYKLVTELNPFNEQAYIYLAQLYISQKKLIEAIELLDEAIELTPHSSAAYHERGRAKLLNGDKDGSIEDMKEALQLNPKENKNMNGKFDNQKPESSGVLDFLG